MSFASKPLFERRSYIHWPSDQFDEEIRQVESDGSGIGREKWVWESVSSRSPDGTSTAEIPVDTVNNMTGDIEGPVLLWEKRDSSSVAASLSAADANIPEIFEDISDSSSDENDESLSAVHSSESISISNKKKTKTPTFWRSAAKLVNSVVPFTAAPKRTQKFCHRGAWWIARRGNCLIGISCTQKTESLHKNLKNPIIALPGQSPANCQVLISCDLFHLSYC